MEKAKVKIKYLLPWALLLCSCSSFLRVEAVEEATSTSVEIAKTLSNSETKKATATLLKSFGAISGCTSISVYDDQAGNVTKTQTETTFNSDDFATFSTTDEYSHSKNGINYKETVTAQSKWCYSEEDDAILVSNETTSAPDISFYEGETPYEIRTDYTERGYESLQAYSIFGGFSFLDFSTLEFGYDEGGNLLAVSGGIINETSSLLGAVYVTKLTYSVVLNIGGSVSSPTLLGGSIISSTAQGFLTENTLTVSSTSSFSFECESETLTPSGESDEFIETFPTSEEGYPKSSDLLLMKATPDYDTNAGSIVDMTLDETSYVSWTDGSHYDQNTKTMSLEGYVSLQTLDPGYYAIVAKTTLYDPWNETNIGQILTTISARTFNVEPAKTGIGFVMVEGMAFFQISEDFEGADLELEVTLDLSDLTSAGYTLIGGGWL